MTKDKWNDVRIYIETMLCETPEIKLKRSEFVDKFQITGEIKREIEPHYLQEKPEFYMHFFHNEIIFERLSFGS